MRVFLADSPLHGQTEPSDHEAAPRGRCRQDVAGMLPIGRQELTRMLPVGRKEEANRKGCLGAN